MLKPAFLLPSQIKNKRLRYQCKVTLLCAVALAGRLRRQDPLARRVELGTLDKILIAYKGFYSMTRPSSTDFEYVENVVREAKSSFAMGMKALPKDRRGYLFAIYAYCRILDDIADNALPREEKLKQLNEWRIKVTQLIDGKPSCAITRILYEAINRFKIPQDELYQLIEGMEADVRGPIYAPCWDDLYDYCRKVAVSVGLLSLPIFGRKDQGAQDFAFRIGIRPAIYQYLA